MITADQLTEAGLDPTHAERVAEDVADIGAAAADPCEQWRQLVGQVLRPDMPFAVHQLLHASIFHDRPDSAGPAPVWLPDDATLSNSNIGTLLDELQLKSVEDLHRWTVDHREDFWQLVIRRLGIRFRATFDRILDPASGVESPRWLTGASMNIVESCFAADGDSPAIVFGNEERGLQCWTVRELRERSLRVAAAFRQAGFGAGNAIAVDMPMSPESVAVYLGIILNGSVAVSIADSFAAPEIATRLRITKAVVIVTQDVIHRGQRDLPLYERVVDANAPPAIVLPAGNSLSVELRDGDQPWDTFLARVGDVDQFEPVACDPAANTNILFSSGTTGDPKAIGWTHTTPIKAAVDGWLHQNIQPGDVVAWPTNLGWMMGPWLIYASLINRATIGLYAGPPTGRGFGQFVQDAGVTMLGVVPSLVKAWRTSDCMRGLDWSRVKAFSSTGECSNPSDMHFLMSLAGYRPVVEYCGGTEIGGGYVCGNTVQPCIPSTFCSPAFGLDLLLIDERGQPTNNGEAFLIGPSMGLSTQLLNRDHHDCYFDGTPTGPNGEVLRRHGDHLEQLPGGYYRAHGRVDDTMNLGGIKASSAEIERLLNTLPAVNESAAIAVPPARGRTQPAGRLRGHHRRIRNFGHRRASRRNAEPHSLPAEPAVPHPRCDPHRFTAANRIEQGHATAAA